MQKATGDSFFPKGMTFAQGLALLKRAGYQGVELWLGDRPWFQMKTSDAEVRQLLGQIQDAGLSVSNVANSLDWEENISARDPAKRDAAIRHIERQIEAAQILKTDAILIVAGLVTEEIPYNEVYKRTVDTLQKLAPIAAKARVKI